MDFEGNESVSQSETLCLCVGGNGGVQIVSIGVFIKKPRLSHEVCVTSPTADQAFYHTECLCSVSVSLTAVMMHIAV